MTDLERDLSALLEGKVDDLRIVPERPPDVVIRRIHKRQAVTVLAASILAVAVLGGSTVGALALLDGISRPSRPAPSTALGTLSTAEVMVTYPPGWVALARTGYGSLYVGDPAPGASAVLPILQVSNRGPSQGGPICPVEGAPVTPLPRDGVLLYVEQVLRFTGAVPQIPVYGSGLQAPIGPPSADPCRGGPPVRFSVGSRVFQAFLVSGVGAKESDRASLLAVFKHLEVDPTYPLPNTLVIPTGPKLLVAEGSFKGSTWTVHAQATEQGPCVGLTFEGGIWAPPGGAGSTLAPLRGNCPGAGPGPRGVMAWRETYRRPDDSRVAFLVGLTDSLTDRVDVELPDRLRMSVTPTPVAEEALDGSMPFAVFVVGVEGTISSAHFVALDADGRVLGTAQLTCSRETDCS